VLPFFVCILGAEVSARALPEPDGGSSNMTELQMHVSFFDRNKDGILTPLETFQGVISFFSCA
jgi:peroxygenase